NCTRHWTISLFFWRGVCRFPPPPSHPRGDRGHPSSGGGLVYLPGVCQHRLPPPMPGVAFVIATSSCIGVSSAAGASIGAGGSPASETRSLSWCQALVV